MPQLQNTSLFTDANLKGYWKLEGNSNDSSPSTINGVDTSVSYAQTTPIFNQYTDFNGTTSRINFNGAGVLNVANSALSIVLWVYPRIANGTPNYCVNKQHSAGNIAPHFGTVYYARVASTAIAFGLSTSGASNQEDSVTVADLRNKWHQIVLTYDGTTKKFYLDGALAGSALQSGNIISDTGDLILGARTVGTNGFLDGLIDDVAILNKVLTAAEVNTLFQQGFSGGMV